MQNRMENHQLTAEQTENLLKKCQVGSLATVNADGTPYITPVHYAFNQGAVYIHGLPCGQKFDNLQQNPNVSFNVYDMVGLIYNSDGNPCNINTEYESAVISGKAELVENLEEKNRALRLIVEKYTPELTDKELPERAVVGTAVIKIKAEKITAKYYK